MEYYIKALQHYADFSGRASRKEYWMFVLVHCLVILGLFVFALILGMMLTPAYSQEIPVQGSTAVGHNTFIPFGGLLILLYLLGTMIPALAVAVRRLHDINKNGWWILTGLAPSVIHNIMLYGFGINNIGLVLLMSFISTAGCIWLLVLLCIDGAAGDNRYGHDPKVASVEQKKNEVSPTTQPTTKLSNSNPKNLLENLQKIRINMSTSDIIAMLGQPSAKKSAEDIFIPLMGRVPDFETGKSYWSYTTPYGSFQVAVKDLHIISINGLEFVIEKIKEEFKAKQSEIRSFGKQQKGQYTYEYYGAGSAKEAKTFLSSREVTQALYYIQVETPEGVWGKDKEGLYLVELLPFQKNLFLAQCEGTYGNFSFNNITMAARGITDNFVGDIVCGSCGAKWEDGLRYNNKTIVRCPECKKYNSVDTSNFKVTIIG
ncbi:MAG: DUF805 domain-containing protein [Prevotellaceae bacterium]|jgi:uncharacterized membrane protein YhaH (DUF805 family)|nr:DUF805 domain-containing protein [Prevotellaceae bacterium]